MEQFSDRLELKIKEMQISNVDVSIIMECSRSMITKYLRGKSVPKDDKIQAFCDKYGVDFNWLRYGQQNQIPEANLVNEPEPPAFKSAVVNTNGRIMMDVTDLLKNYWKEVESIRNLLDVKQEAYREVIFPKAANG